MVNFFANNNQNLIQPVDLFYDPKTNLFAPGANVTDVPSDEGTVINGVYLTPEQKDAITVNLSNGESAVPQDFSNVPIPKRKPVLVAPVEMPEEPVAAEPVAAPVAQEQMATVAPGTEPLPETEDPWYSRIAGTVRNILNLGGKGVSGLAGLAGSGLGYAGMGLSSPASDQRTVIQDWADKFASSPFLAMARNERFDRMRAQANANLDREAKMNRTGSEAGALQIYKHFLGENGYGAPDNTPEQNRMLAQDAYSKTVAFLQSSRSNINIGGEGAKLFNKLNEQMAGDLYEAHNVASSYIPQIDRAINDIESGTLRTGGGSIGDATRRLIADWGMFSPGELAAMSNFDDLNMRMRSAIIEGFKGAISDKEQALITKALPSLGKSPAANAAMLKIYRLKQELANDSYYAFLRIASTVDERDIQDEMQKYLAKRSRDTASKIEAIMGSVPKEDRSSNEGGLDTSRLE